MASRDWDADLLTVGQEVGGLSNSKLLKWEVICQASKPLRNEPLIAVLPRLFFGSI